MEEAAALGCADGEFSGQQAALLAMSGRWPEAEDLARRHEDERRGRARLVLAAADLARGDCTRYLDLARETRDPADLAGQVRRLLALGGHPDLAGRLEAGVACGP